MSIRQARDADRHARAIEALVPASFRLVHAPRYIVASYLDAERRFVFVRADGKVAKGNADAFAEHLATRYGHASAVAWYARIHQVLADAGYACLDARESVITA